MTEMTEDINCRICNRVVSRSDLLGIADFRTEDIIDSICRECWDDVKQINDLRIENTRLKHKVRSLMSDIEELHKKQDEAAEKCIQVPDTLSDTQNVNTEHVRNLHKKQEEKAEKCIQVPDTLPDTAVNTERVTKMHKKRCEKAEKCIQVSGTKLTAEMTRRIQADLKRGESIRSIAGKCGVSVSTVSRIKRTMTRR